MRQLTPYLLALALALPSFGSIPKERPASGLVQDSAPATCNALGLTPRAAVRERRETARRDVEAKEAMRTAQHLRSIASRSLNPLMPAGATPPAVTISTAELVQASARPGVVVTAAVLSANDQLNTRKYYFYDPEGQLLGETENTTSSNPAIEWEYVWFGDKPVAQIHTPTNDIVYYFTDHLETPLILTNQFGQVIWRAEYEPFGAIWTMRVPVPVDEVFAPPPRHQPLRFAGQEAAMTWEGTEERYNIHRWYRPSHSCPN